MDDNNTVQSTNVGDADSTANMLLRFREQKVAKASESVDAPQQEPQTEEKPKQISDSKEKQEPSLNVEDVLKENVALKAEKERLAKQTADTRKWANEQNMKLKALMKDGTIDLDVATKLASNEAALSDNPFQSVFDRWNDDLKRLRPLMAKRGEDVDSYLEAFNAWFADQTAEVSNSVAEEILSLPQDDWTSFMLEKGKDYHDSFYSEIKQNGGSLMNAYKHQKDEFVKAQAERDEFKERYEALKAEMKAELKSGYGKKASLNSSSPQVLGEQEDERPRSLADVLELQQKRRLGLVR